MPEPKSPSPATIGDVAERAGVSIATVSRVINRSARVADNTATRVRAAIAELNYVPQAAARRLASGKMNALGFITDLISVPFFAPLLQGIEGAAREVGFDVLIHCTQCEPSPSPGFHRPLGPHNTDGLLVFAGALDDAELTHLYKNGFPTVLLHQTPPNGLNIPVVTFENKRSARQLVEHLIEVHGCQRIAFLRGPESQEDSRWRELGYREALSAHGVEFDPALVASAGIKARAAQASVEAWLEEKRPIDAVFSWDDDSALEVIQALQKAGKQVPEDMAVVGFDDIHLAHYLAPPLTTVRVPVEKAGREAAHQLVRLITEGQAAPVSLLPTELVIRRSCGCELEVRDDGTSPPAPALASGLSVTSLTESC
jgi:LacI family transcriptional regulator